MEPDCCPQQSISPPPPPRVSPRVQAHTRKVVFLEHPSISEIELVTPSQQDGWRRYSNPDWKDMKERTTVSHPQLTAAS